jgi:hypothetical protein
LNILCLETLTLKYIFRPDLRARLPEVMELWYTLHEQASGLGNLETLLRYVTAAGRHVTA